MKKFLLIALLVVGLAGLAFAAVEIKSGTTVVGKTETLAITGPTIAVSGTDVTINTLTETGNKTITGSLDVTGAVNASSTIVGVGSGYVVQSKRIVSTIAEVNAGVTLLPAVAGRGYRLVNVKVIAVGGAVTSTNVTHLEVRGTQAAGSAVLFKVAKAQLTQSAVNQIGTASTTVLADGASFLGCDTNAAITLNPLGGTDAATATYVHVLIDYVVQ